MSSNIRGDTDSANWRDRSAAPGRSGGARRRGGGRGRYNGSPSQRPQQQWHPPATHARQDAPARSAARGHAREKQQNENGDVGTGSSRGVVGACVQMCPRAEVQERMRTLEISRFERPLPDSPSPSTDKQQGGSRVVVLDASKTVRYDGLLVLLLLVCAALVDAFRLAVKKYRRPAAGRIEIDLTQLRPPQVLLQTLDHLFTIVLPWPGCGFAWRSSPTAQRIHPDEDDNDPAATRSLATDREQSDFLAVYHFISDRVRSVRQDFTIQRIDGDFAVEAMEKVVRFYILASLRARQLLWHPKWQQEWSENLNDQQLASALSQLQVLYQKSEHDSDALAKETEVAGTQHQSEFIAYDILLHADDPRAISFMLLKIPERIRRSPRVTRALALFVALQLQDFHTFFKRFQLATPLEKSLLLKHAPTMWKAAVEMMNKGFGKQDRFELDELARWLQLSGHSEALLLCKAMNLHTETPQAKGGEGEALHVPIPAACDDSWEDAAAPVVAVVPVQRQPQQPAGFIRFKSAPLNNELDQEVTQQLLVDTARTIQRLEIEQLLSASDLVMGCTSVKAPSN